MKILVLKHQSIRSFFNIESQHEIIFASIDDVLSTFIFEQPDIALIFAEYEGAKFEDERTVLRDIVASNCKSKIFRLGFLPEKREEGVKYIRLPVTFRDELIERIIAE